MTDKAFTQQRVETKFGKERPLQLKAPDTEYALVGIKAPWTNAQCKTATEHRQRYEAAINIDWLKAFSAEEGDRVISGDRITYDDIENVRIGLMVMDPNALASAQRRQGLDLLLWLAVDEVNEEMIDYVNDVCRRRAQTSLDEHADPASSRADVMKLSKRNYAQYFQFDDIPEGQEIQHTKSAPNCSRT